MPTAPPAGRGDIIQSLWIGDDLSTLERLSIASFQTHGHPFHLYVYDDLKNVPAGTVVCDGEQILPRSQIFRYSNGSLAGFSNFFRYKLLLERGGWWVDLDMVCLRPFSFETEHVFSSESHGAGKDVINAGAIRAPRGSAFAERAWRVCQSKNPRKLTWGEIGPKLVGETVRKLSLTRCVQQADVFCPVPPHYWRRALESKYEWEFPSISRSVHLWHELWRRENVDKDAPFEPGSLYEILKKKYLP